MSARLRRAGVAAVVSSALLLAYLLLWPLPLSPAAWSPPATDAAPAPRTLPVPERLDLSGARGAEDVVAGRGGWLYTGVRDGRVLATRPGDTVREVADTGGRPLGLAVDAEGRLLVADRVRGLLRVGREGGIERLWTPPPGSGAALNDVAVAPDGIVYATVPSRLPPDERRTSILASRPDGWLLGHDPAGDSTWTVEDSLHFPNGLAAAASGDYLLISETSRYRVLRRWIGGQRAGEVEVYLSGLPGFPDGISLRADGSTWIALTSRRSRLLDALHPHPRRRAVLMRALRLWPFPVSRTSLVLRIGAAGATRSFRFGGGGYGPIANAIPIGGALYLGSHSAPSLARVRLGDVDGSRR